MAETKIAGRCVPNAQDYDLVIGVALKRLGWLTQATMFWCSATFGLAATGFALASNWSVAEVAFAFAIMCYVTAFVAERRTRKMCLDHYLAVHEHLFTLDDDGVTMSDAHTDLRICWAHFDAAFETPTHFALRHCTNAVGLPKRAFSDLDGVRDAIAARISLQPLHE